MFFLCNFKKLRSFGLSPQKLSNLTILFSATFCELCLISRPWNKKSFERNKSCLSRAILHSVNLPGPTAAISQIVNKYKIFNFSDVLTV